MFILQFNKIHSNRNGKLLNRKIQKRKIACRYLLSVKFRNVHERV